MQFSLLPDEKNVHHKSSTGGKASANSVMFNVISSALGAGILSLPWTAAGASVTSAIVILLIALVVNYWTIMILIEGAEKYQVFDLGALLRQIPHIGRGADLFMNSLIWLSNIMCLISYLVIVADNLTKVLGGGPFDNRIGWITLASTVALLLCFLDQAALGFTSTCAVVVNIYLFATVFFAGVYSPAQPSPTLGPVCYFAFTKGSIAMFSALMTSFVIQMCVLPLYEELEDRSVEKFRTIMQKSFVFCFFLFAAFIYFALKAFGNDVNSNVLTNLPSGVFGTMAQVGMAGVVLCVYPLMLMPMVAPVKHQLGKVASGIATAAITLFAMLVTYVAPNLGVLVVLNGAVSVCGFVGLAPALVGLCLLGRDKASMYSLLIFALVMTVLGVLLPLNYVEDLQNSCLWIMLPFSRAI